MEQELTAREGQFPLEYEEGQSSQSEYVNQSFSNSNIENPILLPSSNNNNDEVIFNAIDASSILFEEEIDTDDFHMDEIESSIDLNQFVLSSRSAQSHRNNSEVVTNSQPHSPTNNTTESRSTQTNLIWITHLQNQFDDNNDDFIDREYLSHEFDGNKIMTVSERSLPLFESVLQPIRSKSPELGHINRQIIIDPDILESKDMDEVRESTASTVAMLNSIAMANLQHPEYINFDPEKEDGLAIGTSHDKINLEEIKTRLFNDNLMHKDQSVNDVKTNIHDIKIALDSQKETTTKSDRNTIESSRPSSQRPFRVPAPPSLRPYIPTPSNNQAELLTNQNQNQNQNQYQNQYSSSTIHRPDYTHSGLTYGINTLRPFLGRATDSYLQLLQYSHSGWYPRPNYLYDYLTSTSSRYNQLKPVSKYQKQSSHILNESTYDDTSTPGVYDTSYSRYNKYSAPSLPLKITPVKRLYTSQFWRERLDTRDFASIVGKLL